MGATQKKARDQKHMEVNAQNTVRHADIFQPASDLLKQAKKSSNVFKPHKEKCGKQQLLLQNLLLQSRKLLRVSANSTVTSTFKYLTPQK